MFKDYLNKENIEIMDFLADHIGYSYSLFDLKKFIKKDILKNLNELVEFGFVIKEDKKYKLNTENDLIKAMLKFDFEYGKKIAYKS